MNKILSFFKLLKINIERVTDHSIRILTGLPTLKRSQITKNLYVGGQYNVKKIKHMKKMGINAVVNMRMTKDAIHKNREWEHYLQLPTPDMTAPTMQDLHKGVAFIQKYIDNDEKVYVHCHHGEGRGPTMAIAYLMSIGITLDDALEQIQKIRTFAMPTKSQMKRLQEFEEKLRNETELTSSTLHS